MFHQHDRDGIGARKMLRAAIRAIALPAAFGDLRRPAALGAEAMPRVPVHQTARAAIDREVVGRERGHRRPQCRIGHARRAVAPGRDTGETGPVSIQPEKDQFGIFGSLGEAGPGKRACIVHARHQAVEREQPRAPAHHACQALGIGPNVVGAVDPRSGEGQRRRSRHRDQAAARMAVRSDTTAAGKPSWIG